MRCSHKKKYCECELKAAVALAMGIDFSSEKNMLNALWNFVEKASGEVHEEEKRH